MKLIQGGFEALHKVEIDMQFVHESQVTQMPESKEYGKGVFGGFERQRRNLVYCRRIGVRGGERDDRSCAGRVGTRLPQRIDRRDNFRVTSRLYS